MIFVDTNYFIRFFLNDIPEQGLKARELFNNASEGNLELSSSTIVFFEIYWVFSRYYNKSKIEVIDILKKVMSMNFIYFEETGVLQESLRTYKETSLELEDCYNLAYAKVNGVKEFKTFDKKILKLINK